MERGRRIARTESGAVHHSIQSDSMFAEIMHERGTGSLMLNGRPEQGSTVSPDLLCAPLTVTGNPSGAKRAAQAAPSYRDEVLGKVAHELRTPLSTILMTTGFVLDALVPPDPCTALRQHLETTMRAATLMTRLIDDLLEGATLASGRLALARTSVRAKDLFATANTLLRPIAAARHITLTFIEDEDLPSFNADEGRLVQVIANLVGNAIKFSEPGGQITVSVHLGSQCISFRVADSGPGIAAGDLAHVFDQFWQAPARRHLGVGLGLAIAREIVDAHGGQIGVRSTVGRGSVFGFTIPL